jgi:hypothetical protein
VRGSFFAARDSALVFRSTSRCHDLLKILAIQNRFEAFEQPGALAAAAGGPSVYVDTSAVFSKASFGISTSLGYISQSDGRTG